MTLENVAGNLLAYKKLEPGTFQHVDQLTTERRTNPGLRNEWFYTADGNIYTVRRNKNLWAITRLPQNLVLGNIDEAYRQLTGQGNYFPSVRKARQALNHEDTVIVEQEGLELEQSTGEYGHFVIDPRNVRALNSQRRIAAVRLFGPDEDSFEKNMEMFAKERKNPYVFALMSDYVQGALKESDKKFLMRASWLDDFNYNSDFDAYGRDVGDHGALRGVRRVIAEGDAPEKEVPLALRETGQENSGVVTLERMLDLSREFVPIHSWSVWEETLRKEYKQ